VRVRTRSVSIPESWIEFSERNIRRSQSERAASRDIRGQIDQLIQSVTTSIASEWNGVNSAFSDRIAEYIDARNKIQAHLSKVRHRLSSSGAPTVALNPLTPTVAIRV